MKINFNSEFSKNKGVVLFICNKNEPMHWYLTDLNKNANYIKHAMKVVNFDYKDNNQLDLILPKGGCVMWVSPSCLKNGVGNNQSTTQQQSEKMYPVNWLRPQRAASPGT